jgi:hypothetical protein
LIPWLWKLCYFVHAAPPKCYITKVTARRNVELENPLQNKKTAQNGPKSITDPPKKYQPKTESGPAKEQKHDKK